MNAVERMVEYTSQPTEGSTQALTQEPPQGWPHAGAITIDNLQVSPELLIKEVITALHRNVPDQNFFAITCRSVPTACQRRLHNLNGRSVFD